MLRILVLSIALATAACGPSPDAQRADIRARFDTFLMKQIGKDEADLVRAMKRMPDANYQADAATRMLNWKLAATTTTPGQPPDYYAIGGQIVPLGATAATTSTDYCTVEWIIASGIAKAYSLRGKGCP